MVIHPPIYGAGPFERSQNFQHGLITIINPCAVKGISIFLALAEKFPDLKFGALPLSFTLQTRDQISPTLGSEQLRMGLVAGIIGFVLVFLYSLAQYRALGLVTVLSIVIAAGLTYVAIALLGWSHNFRLDMAGVTGLIVAIGVTADSFIVYFERIRDEVREGRPLRAARPRVGGHGPHDDRRARRRRASLGAATAVRAGR